MGLALQDLGLDGAAMVFLVAASPHVLEHKVLQAAAHTCVGNVPHTIYY